MLHHLFGILVFIAASAHAQTLRWTQPLAEPTFPADAGAFFTSCQSDAAGHVVAVVGYNKTDGPNQPFAGTKVFWFTNLGKPIHSDEFLAANVSEVKVLNVSATVLLVALYASDGTITLRRYVRRTTGITFADTPLPDHEMYPQPPQTDRLGFFVCQKVNGRPAFLKRYTR